MVSASDGLLCLGLVAVIYNELDRPSIEPLATAAPGGARAGHCYRGSSLFHAAAAGLRRVLARPLFSTTRRAPPETATGAPAPPAAFTLVGIVISSSGAAASERPPAKV
jgi:hypothetical protein